MATRHQPIRNTKGLPKGTRNIPRNERRERRLLRTIRHFWVQATAWAHAFPRRDRVVPFFGQVNPVLSNHWKVDPYQDSEEAARLRSNDIQVHRRLRFKGREYLSVEHAYMAHKAITFGRPDLAAIWTNGTGSHSVHAGRGIRRFQANNPKHVKSWSTIVFRGMKHRNPAAHQKWESKKLGLMYRLNWAKYRQFAGPRNRLLATGSAYLVENSPFDEFWGVGRELSPAQLQKGPLDPRQPRDVRLWGQNRMGLILMAIRRRLVVQAHVVQGMKRRTKAFLARVHQTRQRRIARQHGGAVIPDAMASHFGFQFVPIIRWWSKEYNRTRKTIEQNFELRYDPLQ